MDHLRKNDTTLHAVAVIVGLPKLSSSTDYFVFLCESIVSQQLSVKASDTIFSRFKKLFLREIITPKQILLIPDDEIRKAGISYTKISYIKDLAKHCIEKKIPQKFDAIISEEEIITQLIQVKGIGRWTAEMFLMSALGRPDVFSYGDLALRRAIQKLYKLEKEPTKKEAEELAKKWSPYRTYASRILWQSLAVSRANPSISDKSQRKS